MVIRWNQAALQAVRDSKLGPPMVSRALAIVHTCMYDAWAAYDERALSTRLGGAVRQPHSQRQQPKKTEAISFAAFRALVDLFAKDEQSVFRPLMEQLGYDPDDTSTNTSSPSGVGNARVPPSSIFGITTGRISSAISLLAERPMLTTPDMRP